jgi:uncharacterized protein YceK
MLRVIISLSAVLALSGCAVVKDFVRNHNCGTQSISHTGCSNAQLIEEEPVAAVSSGKINPYSGDLSQAYID